MWAKRVVFVGPERLEIESFDVPKPGPRQVVVRTTRTLVSAGTEVKRYLGNDVGRNPPRYPIYPGYSHVGVVEQVGEAVHEVRVGDRVGTQKGHASHVLVDLEPQPPAPNTVQGPRPGPRVDWLQVLPEGITDEQATFAVLGSVAMHGVRKAAVRLDETCAVAGMGVVGQIAGQLARLNGARALIGLDLVTDRLESGLRSGFDFGVNPGSENAVERVLELTGGRGVDVALDCTSTTHAFPDLLRLTAPEARIVIIGSLLGKVEISLFDEVQLKELNIIGAFQPMAPTVHHPALPWTQAANRKSIMDLIATGRLKVDHLISHVSPADQAGELFRLVSQSHRGWLGVIFEW